MTIRTTKYGILGRLMSEIRRFNFSTLLILVLLAVKVTVAFNKGIRGDMSQWNTIPGFKRVHRFWEIEDLEPAYEHMGSLYLVKNLLDKLASGKRIISVAFGSSFVANFAGCWHPSMKSVFELGIVPNPYLYPQPGQSTLEISQQKCAASGGYMEGFMDTVNRTWPNSGHILLNNGRGGMSLDEVAKAYCVKQFVPEDVDFVLLDPMTNIASPESVETILRGFLSSRSQPLVMLLSNTHNCQDARLPPGSTADPGLTCARQCLLLHNLTACTSLGPEPYPEASYRHLEDERRPIQSLAAYYDVPHLSLHPLLVKSLLTSEMCKRHNSTKWQMLAHLYTDTVHFQQCHVEFNAERLKAQIPGYMGPDFPCVKSVGPLLTADLLVNYLFKMQTLIAAMSEGQEQALRWQLPRVVHQGAAKVFHTKCYAIPFGQISNNSAHLDGPGLRDSNREPVPHLNTTTSVNGTLIGLKSQQGMEQLNLSPGQDDPQQPQSFKMLPFLNITRSDGFIKQGYYKGAAGQLMFKPGFFTSTAGAILEFELSTVFYETPDVETEIVLTYTSSYDGWGKARISCEAGCTCSSMLVDASSARRSSLLTMHSIPTTQHASCRVRVQIDSQTSSSGHKFKVSSVMVRALANGMAGR